MLHHEPLYRDVLYGGWFDTITLILWPNSFYLTVMVAKEPAMWLSRYGALLFCYVPRYMRSLDGSSGESQWL